MNAFDKIKKWMFGDETTARKRAERHQPKVSIGLATAESGDRQDDIDGLDVGGVIWPVEQGTHGGVSFISSQCFYATYDKKAKKVWLLDNETGTRHPGALPLIPDDTVFPEPDTGGRGLVIRTALFGNDGLKRNVFIPLNAKLEAHHEQPDPPINSSQVFDEDGRHGGLHYLTRVRLMVTKLCLGATDKLSEVFAPMLNFTRNGDGTPAHGVATFRNSNAMLSHEVDGPLAPADDDQHIGGVTSDGRKLHSGGIDRSRALYGDGAGGILFSPKEFVKEPWQSGGRDAFPGRVEEREDFNDSHVNLCGKKARGKKKWMEWKPKASPPEVPPTAPPPEQPPPPIDGPPRDPTFPPPRNVFPKPDPVPLKSRLVPPVTSQPTNTGPAEEEQPSLRGIARPDFDPPTGTGFEEAYSHGVGTQDEIWKRATGMTQREFFDLRRVSHDVAQGVAAATLPAGVSSSPVLMKAYLQSTFVQDSKGQWYGRRGNAIGFQTLMPGGLEGHMAYKARNGSKLTASQTLTRLFLNYAIDPVTATPFIETKLAVGARKEDVDTVVSGFDIGLDYSASTAEPDALITFRDAEGGPVAGQRLLNADGEVFAYLSDIGAGTGDMTAEGTDGDDFAGAGLLLTANGNNKTARDIPVAATVVGPDVILEGAGAVTLRQGAGTDMELGLTARTTSLLGLALLAEQAKLAINTPSQITANQTGYTGFNTKIIQRVSSDAARAINTILAPTGAAGGFLVITNIGSFNITFTDDSAASGTAADRIITGLGAAYTLGPAQTMEMYYDTTSSRWRII